MSWKDGYWEGSMRDGYPESYFEGGQFKYPWQKDGSGSGSLAQSGRAGSSNISESLVQIHHDPQLIKKNKVLDIH